MPDANHADVVILGAGSGGYACALRAAQLGLSVVLVEKDRLGGTCLHQGCIPTKAMLHAAEVADAARDSASFGIQARFDGVDVPALHAYRDGVVARLFKGLTGLIASRGITVVSGAGRLVAPDTVEVEGVRYQGKHVVLATGSVPRPLPIAPVDGVRILDSDGALALDRVPESVIVLGGGVIGCEFASVWRSFGAAVTIVEAQERILPTEDVDSSTVLARAFRRRGIAMKTAATVSAVNATASEVSVTLDDGKELTADVVLVAIGRMPRTENLGFLEAGIALERGFVLTDPTGRTNVPNVWAVGDIVPGLQLAHRGFAHGIAVAQRIAGEETAPLDESTIPRVTYSDPEVASVGLSEAAAAERFGAENLDVVRYDLSGNGKSQILKTAGHVKLIRQQGGPVVGIHLVGSRVGELIGEAQLIYGWDAVPADIVPLLHAHPTQNEALGEAHLALAGQPLHAHS